MGILFVAATPIGNLKDITLRAIETLKSVDIIFAEDTRVVKKLLAHYEITKPVMRYDEHVHEKTCVEILTYLKEGKNVALVTDAGTPCICDPGSRLIDMMRKKGVRVVPVPGVSAVITALSCVGFPTNTFTFLGYPPQKKGRETFFEDMMNITMRPIVFYESPHRIEKTLLAVEKNFGNNKEIIIARELTKIHEEIITLRIEEAKKRYGNKKARGEFVIIIP